MNRRQAVVPRGCQVAGVPDGDRRPSPGLAGRVRGVRVGDGTFSADRTVLAEAA